MSTATASLSAMRSLLIILAAALVVLSLVAVSAAYDDFYGPAQEQDDLLPPDAAEDCNCTSFAGTWYLEMDVECDSIVDFNRTLTLSADLTWIAQGFSNSGSWSQDKCNVELIDTYVVPSVIWVAVFHDGQWSGVYNNGYSGCFTGTPEFTVEEDCSTSPTDEGPWGNVKRLFR